MGGKGGSMCMKSEEYDKPVVGEIEAHGIKDAHCKEPTVGESETPGSMFGKLETNEMATGGESETPGSMFGKLETNEMATGGEIRTPGSTLLMLETHEMPTGGEIGNPGSMFMMCETHEMPESGEIGTHESIGAELETHEMPASGEIGTHESISAELETHEMPTCGEIQSPRIMFAKLETHQTPTVAEIETLGMDSQVYQHASESLIAFGWRLSLEDNALEFFFPSAHIMSRIVGVGLEFAKVVVSTSNLNVKIIGIGKTSWKNVWSNFTTLDKKFEVISLDGVTGAGSHNNSSIEYLTGEESASKYGVGLCSGNTVRVQFTDAPHESDYCWALHNLVEYLMLKKVDLSKIGVQCTQDGGAGSSSHGGNNSDQANNNVTSLIGQVLSYTSYLSKGKWKSNTGDDEDDLSPSKRAQKVEHDSAKKNICKITVLPGPGGFFWSKEGTKLEEAPNGLDDASIDPEFEFEFDKNGKIGKQIYVRTTTTFDLGNAAPTRKVKNSFGWYHDNLKTTLRTPKPLWDFPFAKLGFSDLLMGNPKDTKSSVRRTQTHSDNDESEVGAELQLGYQGTHLKGSFRKKGTKGVTSAREEANENCTSSDVWRGFIYQNLRSTKNNSACWNFTCNLPSPLPLEVLTDDNEWKKYLGSGMCGALQPIFDTKWRIQEEDNTENSVYEFEAERTLNMLSTINGRRECLEINQKYGLRMFVNHAMNHLSNVKDNHVLSEWQRSLPGVMTVGFETVLTSGSG
jgi:hypothetical protein